MPVHKEDQDKKQYLFTFVKLRNFFEEEETSTEESNDFLSLATKLRQQKEKEADETQALYNDIIDWMFGRAMDVLYITGTALGNRLHDMTLGQSNNTDSEVL